MFHRFVTFCPIIVCFLLFVHRGWGQTPEPIDFSREIQPILSENCYFCHGPDANVREADLRLDQESSVSDVLEPGNADDSELYRRVMSDDPGEQMPPPESHRSLSLDQKKLIQRWIDEGANWSTHWAFAPIRKQELPAHAAIDWFVRRQLEDHDLSFSPRADRRTLIRRVSLDLTGLPPSPEEVEMFLADESEEAYLAMVDRYLDSPAYGERMAWNWLDAARYADTNGYQGDRERTMWPWRDWVIRAYNDNLPFDEFSIWQLAGDQLPEANTEQILATGFLRNHPINGEGGRIPAENRVDYVMDMAETTGTIWMGLTFNCCRCHDHKYDQLSQKDYYRMFAFFNQTPVDGSGGDPQTSPAISIPTNRAQQRKYTQLQTTIADLTQQQADLAATLADEQSTWERQWLQDRLEGTGGWAVFAPNLLEADHSKLEKLDDLSILSSGPNPLNDTYRLAGELVGLNRLAGIRLEVLNHPSMTRGGLSRSASSNFVLTELKITIENSDPETLRRVRIRSAVADYHQNGHPVELSFDGNSKTGWAVYQNGNNVTEEREAVFRLDPIDLTGGERIRVELAHDSPHKNHNIGRFRISFTDREEPGLTSADDTLHEAISKQPGERTTAQSAMIANAYLQDQPEYRQIHQELESSQKELDRLTRSMPKVMVMEDLAEPRKTYRLERGSYQQPREQVHAQVPEIFQPLPENGQANRLALARWLFDDSNPLTARVTVNRLWEQFFGVGLVKTSEDFGVQGEPPSHPELLDWLAAEFRDSGWDTKHMVRLMLNSQTYQQESRTSREQVAMDPENRLLARASRRRMPFWMLRDQALAVSGQLVDQIGGPPVNTYQPEGVWEEASFGKKKYKLGTGEELYRRSVYIFWRRIAPPTMFFDNADRMTCSVKTYQTNTPLHALYTLNDTAFVESARWLATRAIGRGNDDAKRIEFVFQQVMARQPDEFEVGVLMTAVQRSREEFGSRPEAAAELIQVGESKPSHEIDPVELASWTSLALAVLNLDEALTRH